MTIGYYYRILMTYIKEQNILRVQQLEELESMKGREHPLLVISKTFTSLATLIALQMGGNSILTTELVSRNSLLIGFIQSQNTIILHKTATGAALILATSFSMNRPSYEKKKKHQTPFIDFYRKLVCNPCYRTRMVNYSNTIGQLFFFLSFWVYHKEDRIR